MYRNNSRAGLSILALVLMGVVAAGPVFGETDMDQPEARSIDIGDSHRLLFIHHSCGGQLLAAPGEQVGGEPGSGRRCIYESHPNGGDLRRLLGEAGYEVHDLTYESELGQDTDIHHWRRKFSTEMPRLLQVDDQDRTYDDQRRNGIIAFKSCFPNNDFVEMGTEPGDPDSSRRTVANAKAAYRSLLPAFAAQPEVLFVAFTAPPMAQTKPSGLKARLKAAFDRSPSSAELARIFNSWLADRENGWLSEYAGSNVVVFDYYDILTGGGATDWSHYPTGGGRDSHPSVQGNGLAAEAFVPFLNQAVARMR